MRTAKNYNRYNNQRQSEQHKPTSINGIALTELNRDFRAEKISYVIYRMGLINLSYDLPIDFPLLIKY